MRGQKRKRKGGVMLLLLLTVTVRISQAQTFAEWLNQKKTQLKYLAQQIEALQVYRGYVKQGYAISQQGLGAIGGWKDGEFSLHGAYYASLKTVNPAVRDNPKASAVVTLASEIPGVFAGLLRLEGLSGVVLVYVRKVRDALLADVDRDISELQSVMTAGELELTDDERLKRLDGVYARMLEKAAFTRSFAEAVRVSVSQGKTDLLELQTLGRLYGVG